MSLTPQRGLLGLSNQTSIVRPGWIASAISFRFSVSQKVTCNPWSGASTASQLRSAQYITLGATTCAPLGRLRNKAVAADMPEPVSKVAAAPSSAPITASASRTVSLSARP